MPTDNIEQPKEEVVIAAPLETTPSVEVTNTPVPKTETTKADLTATQPRKEDSIEAAIDEATTLDDFEAVKQNVDKKDVVKTEVKVEPKKEEPKKEEVTKVDDKIKVEVTPKADDTTKPKARDYSGLDEKLVPLFKGMSNDAFNTLKPLVLDIARIQNDIKTKDAEITKLKTSQGINESLYEHPLGFILTPEFNKASKAVDDSKNIFDHWSNQLSKVRNGATEYEMVGFDNKGNLVITGKVPADANAQTTLLAYFNHAQNQLMDKQKDIGSLQANFKTEHSKVKGWVDESNQAFSKLDESNHPLKVVVDDTLNKFPASIKSNPLAPLYAKSLTVIAHLGKLLGEAKAKGATATTVKEDKKAAGPTVSSTMAVSEKVEPEITWDDFQKAKES